MRTPDSVVTGAAISAASVVVVGGDGRRGLLLMARMTLFWLCRFRLRERLRISLVIKKGEDVATARRRPLAGCRWLSRWRARWGGVAEDGEALLPRWWIGTGGWSARMRSRGRGEAPDVRRQGFPVASGCRSRFAGLGLSGSRTRTMRSLRRPRTIARRGRGHHDTPRISAVFRRSFPGLDAARLASTQGVLQPIVETAASTALLRLREGLIDTPNGGLKRLQLGAHCGRRDMVSINMPRVPTQTNLPRAPGVGRRGC